MHTSGSDLTLHRIVLGVAAVGLVVFGVLSRLFVVLDLSRVEAGRLEIRPEDVSLAEVVQASFGVVRPQAEQRGNELVARIDPDADAIHTDRARLRQVLVNLLSNAATFTENGRIEVVAARGEGPSGPQVVIQVVDTGCGIPEEALPTLFDIGVQSAEGRGSTFEVRIPVRWTASS